jgi:dihydrofolate synthase/folylpolyglutamate synthase
MIAQTLSLAGYVTGEYTSPYIRVWSDRIRVNGMNIPDDSLCRIVEQVKPVFDREQVRYSQFELTTIIAFLYFASQKCDLVVLETGIGGLLDCTNIVSSTLVSVITSISYDHTAILGDTLEAIAEQKAGIIKPDTAAVLYPDNPIDVERIIFKTAMLAHCDFIKPDTDKLKIISSDVNGSAFRYRGKNYNIKMAGKHQIFNALTAIETLEYLRRLGYSRIRYSFEFEGLADAYLISRCQIIHDKPLIILDGAHNSDGMKKLAELVREQKNTPKMMIVGMREDKAFEDALTHIIRYIDTALCVDGFIPGTVHADKIAQLFSDGRVVPISEAVRRAVILAGEDGMIVIGGSLYLAEALNKYMI